MNFNICENIKAWHNNLSWDSQGYNTGKMDPIINDFFSNRFIPEFWKHLELQDIIALASIYIEVAQIAYAKNYSFFRCFFNKVWNEHILDFSFFESIDLSQFNFIQSLFIDVETIIFTESLPDTFLNFIVGGKKFIFYPIMRPLLRKFPTQSQIRNANIVIYGFNKINYNPVIDILLSFRKINRLELINIKCTKMVLYVLNGITFKKILIRDIFLSSSNEKLLVDAITSSKQKTD